MYICNEGDHIHVISLLSEESIINGTVPRGQTLSGLLVTEH